MKSVVSLHRPTVNTGVDLTPHTRHDSLSYGKLSDEQRYAKLFHQHITNRYFISLASDNKLFMSALSCMW